MSYRIGTRRSARRHLEVLPRKVQHGIAKRIDSLASDPRPHWSKPLHRDLAGRRSFRVGGYRIVYRVADDVLLLLVIDIGRRGRVDADTERGPE